MTSSYDNQLWTDGVQYLTGIDEVGRGPLAGPVVAAAVILDPQKKIYKIDDSKKLTEKKRLLLEPRIKEKALAWAVAEASVEEINSLNIINATFLAMKRAIDLLEIKPQFVLVDGRDFPTFLYREQGTILQGRPLVKGDSISVSVASASILAKVYRDNLMIEMSEKYPAYGFEKHKGYAAKEHMDAIRKSGPCELHRKKFIRNIMHQKSEQLSLV
ncbi:MAG: ribonuclease HII [Calditrichaeota bacterium]|nr:MAG: ribonuclease HII [Calditrichota bacterium]MBL1207604.1 ribonuclease HII [Calditrichota bacterium]NOG47437.1 ribonuclease HII [Calditrichota bacterium]